MDGGINTFGRELRSVLMGLLIPSTASSLDVGLGRMRHSATRRHSNGK